MDIQERQLLQETAQLARDNNKLLKKMHRAAVTSRAIRVVYWLVILGFAFGSFYFLQPYLEQVQTLYQGAQGVLDDVKGVQGVLESFGN